jgi:hypothetical protein
MTLGNSISLSRCREEIKWKRMLLSSQHNAYAFPIAERYLRHWNGWMDCTSYKTDPTLSDSLLRLGTKFDCVVLLSHEINIWYIWCITGRNIWSNLEAVKSILTY